MKQLYKSINFSGAKLVLIDKICGIVDEYIAAGYRLTVRQLYYQLVARDVVENTIQSYKRIVGIVSDARYAGMLDWDAIEDRTREFVTRGRWSSAKDVLESAAHGFHMDMWTTQEWRVFAIVEKEALAGVIERACRPFDVPMLAARGYCSGSVLREFATEDIVPALEEGKRVLVLHLGDHDPSGIDMTRDMEERLGVFCEDAGEFEMRRIALNMDQVRRYRPPPNPAKETDSRHGGYSQKFGGQSWELDALKPEVLAALVSEHISGVVDMDAWKAREAVIEAQREYIQEVADEAPEPEDEE